MVNAATSIATSPAQYEVTSFCLAITTLVFLILFQMMCLLCFFRTGTKCASLVAVWHRYFSGVRLASLACLGLGEPWQTIF